MEKGLRLREIEIHLSIAIRHCHETRFGWFCRFSICFANHSGLANQTLI
jgi:hypothetical protein